MKKTILILTIVIAATIVVYVADKATRIHTSAAMRPAVMKAGEPAPDISVKDLDDKSVTLAEYKDKLVLVNFRETPCDHCPQQIPYFVQLTVNYRPNAF